MTEALEHLADEPDDEKLALLEQSVASWSSAISAALHTDPDGDANKQSVALATFVLHDHLFSMQQPGNQ